MIAALDAVRDEATTLRGYIGRSVENSRRPPVGIRELGQEVGPGGIRSIDRAGGLLRCPVHERLRTEPLEFGERLHGALVTTELPSP